MWIRGLRGGRGGGKLWRWVFRFVGRDSKREVGVESSGLAIGVSLAVSGRPPQGIGVCRD